VLVAVLLLTAGCGGGDEPNADGARPEPSASRSIRTLTPVSLPPQPPPTGRLIVDIEQSSRDAAANRFEVWVDNDTDAPIRPTRVTYEDGRFRTPLVGTRLREIPSQSRRGFQIIQPDRPVCASDDTAGTLSVDYTVHGERRTMTVPVSDEADVIARIWSARCIELTIAKIAHLRWADAVTASGDGGQGSVGTMTLVVDTTGRPGPTLVIDSIVGNPVLSPGEHGVFNANLTITGDQPPQRIPVPVKPTRCDLHAFGESGNFAAFAFNVHVDGQPGQFVLSMGTTAAAHAIDYAKASCGFLTTIEGNGA
jgi:hypothetical protein